MTAEEFSTAIARLMAEAKAKGLSDQVLLLKIQDIVYLLRKRLAD